MSRFESIGSFNDQNAEDEKISASNIPIEQKKEPVILQKKVEEIWKLADQFTALEKERWNWTEVNDAFYTFNRVRERERHLIAGRLSKYGTNKNMGSPSGRTPRGEDIILDEEGAADLEDIKNQMLEVINDIKKYPLTPEFPSQKNPLEKTPETEEFAPQKDTQEAVIELARKYSSLEDIDKFLEGARELGLPQIQDSPIQQHDSVLNEKSGTTGKKEIETEKKVPAFEIDSLSIGEIDNENPNRRNQDSKLERPRNGVFAVFDGVGGNAKGDEASALAMEVIDRESARLPEKISVQEAESFARSALKKANQAVLDQRELTQSNMASTATVAVVCYDERGNRKLVVGNAGDSRAYLHTEGKLEQITIDDDYIRKHVPGGDTQARKLQKILDTLNDLSEVDTVQGVDEDERFILNQAMQKENRDHLTNNLGRDKFDASITTVDFPEDAELLLFSDGIADNLSDSEIEKILNAGASIEELVQAALKSNRKPDDITGMIVKNKRH